MVFTTNVELAGRRWVIAAVVHAEVALSVVMAFTNVELAGRGWMIAVMGHIEMALS